MALHLISGDWHGNLDHARRVMDAAHAQGINHIVQVGDFGWWPHIQDGEHNAYAGRVNDYAAKRGLNIDWLDGNHENFDDLESRTHAEDGRGVRYYERPGSGTGKILTNVGYMPRGLVLPLDGKSAFVHGGAASVDKAYRTQGHSWWPQENITQRQVYEALDNARPVDYMFTHDAPAFPPGLPQGWKEDTHSNGNRSAIYALMDAYTPKVLFHGHYHLPYTTTIPYGHDMQNRTQVYGLGADRNLEGGNRGSNVVLDTDTDSVTPLEGWLA